MKNLQITQYTRLFIRQQVKPGDLCMDATMGNGNDTALLSLLAGEKGRVVAFDIQPQALENTRNRLEQEGCPDNYELVQRSHEYMEEYGEAGSVSCITFNLGYLPGGDHAIATRADSSIKAIQSGIRLLKKGGLMTICIYSGGDTGFEERDRVLGFLENIDPHECLVIRSKYANRPNNPPVPVLLIKLK